jgi:hypothetical protein
MRRRNLFIIIIILSTFTLNTWPQETTITFTDTYVSRYIWRGQDLYPDNDAAHQPSVDISFSDILNDIALSLNIWASFPLNKGHQDAEEIDYTLTLSKNLTETLNTSFGYTYFDFPNTASQADVQEPWISFTLSKIPIFNYEISLNLFAGYDFKTTSGGPDEGWYYSWGVSIEIPLESILTKKQSLILDITNWGNDGVADLKPSSLYATELSLSTSYNLGKFTITPSLHYTINYEDEINSGDEELWGGIEFSYVF